MLSRLNNPPLLLSISFFLLVPPSIVGLNPEGLNVVVNNFVSLSCEATGFPPPTLSWLNDRGPIQANANAVIMPGMESIGFIMWIASAHDEGAQSPERVFSVLF